MMVVLALFAVLFAPDAGAPLSRVETWVGHEVLNGKRKVPVFGDKPTHVENNFIAEFQRTGSKIRVTKRLCSMTISPVGRVRASMKPESVTRLPPSTFYFEEKSGGQVITMPFTHGWQEVDVDGDTFPGATLDIAGSCTGRLYVSNQSTTTWTQARMRAGKLKGRQRVQLSQKILGAKGFCLRLLSGDSLEDQEGYFTYEKAVAGTTCQSLQGKTWPVSAYQDPL